MQSARILGIFVKIRSRTSFAEIANGMPLCYSRAWNWLETEAAAMEQKRTWELSVTSLQLIAMTAMLLDHIYYNRLLDWQWLTCVGRIAFPIYCFLAVEAFFHTRSFQRYLLRLLLFALLSEIPYDLMGSGQWFALRSQNVMWTLLLGLCGVWCMERAKQCSCRWVVFAVIPVVLYACWYLGNLGRVDYRGAGAMTVCVFWMFRGRKWWCLTGLFLSLLWIHTQLLRGYYYNISVFGVELGFGRQVLSLFALLPILLYRGKRGFGGKGFQRLRYVFYPAHMLLLYLLRLC